MTEKFDLYTEQLTSLIQEAIACSPKSWHEGWLSIDCDGSYMNYALKNEQAEDKAQISSELRQLCEDLYVVMRKSGDWWIKAVIHFFRKDGSWSFKVNFTYQDSPASGSAMNKPAAPSKPWWKLW
ncbi:hypothetical protein [Chromobacterium alticapitis]|uniref:DUF600 domain-containing protein n=1 Tax=Chromobacterium alticapitis TaxID=2073169 RepID=A0A2S5DAK3_9NEIS|nr:hypothetical protein [Chromobacterium alticapitis]POZ60130.1 hypothetical protein C2I19_20585 [Chromobacterium alticapitis]